MLRHVKHREMQILAKANGKPGNNFFIKLFLRELFITHEVVKSNKKTL